VQRVRNLACTMQRMETYHTFQKKRVRFDEVKKTVKAKINMDLDDVIINVPIMGVLENVEIPERRRRFNIREDPFELSDRQFI